MSHSYMLYVLECAIDRKGNMLCYRNVSDLEDRAQVHLAKQGRMLAMNVHARMAGSTNIHGY